MKRNSRNHGQSLIETAIFFCILAPLVGMLLSFTRYMQIREKLILAAWQGAQLYSCGAISPEEARQKVEIFLTSGSPRLPLEQLHIEMGRADGNFLDEIDRVSVTYTLPHAWHAWLNLSQTLEESCYVKHAPHYWDPISADFPIPGQPALTGPVYRW